MLKFKGVSLSDNQIESTSIIQKEMPDGMSARMQMLWMCDRIARLLHWCRLRATITYSEHYVTCLCEGSAMQGLRLCRLALLWCKGMEHNVVANMSSASGYTELKLEHWHLKFKRKKAWIYLMN